MTERLLRAREVAEALAVSLETVIRRGGPARGRRPLRRLHARRGHQEYPETAGNRSVLMLRRDDGERSEFVMVTLPESWEALRAFAGDEVDRAVFYPEDDAFLIERDLTATHYQVAEARGI